MILFVFSMQKVTMSKRAAGLFLLLIFSALAVTACGSSSGGGKNVALVAYSTPKSAYEQLIPAFEATPDGKGASFSQSYGGSGEQSRAVTNGQHADVVNFSLEPDVERLVKAGMVSAGWNQNATHGFVTNSVVVMITRKGNPKHVTGWPDLLKADVQVVTPNPFTSGGARWNIMAAYGAQLKEGKTPAQAQAYLTQLFRKVVSQDSSARNSLQTFLAGRGDVLLGYENEAIAAQKKGAAIDYTIPTNTLLIESPVAAVGSSSTAQHFVSYLVSPAAQAIWASKGYRPVIPGVAASSKFPTPAGLFRIASVGGWKAVTKQFFDPEAGIVTKIEQSLGVSTAK
ncbi:MAG: sulfate transporter, periplasmic sulfate-binding protein [Solirubrobacterales bacterium]|nr:sulfate transporter, periplasmic sulfate-binding protein [Solirubrobacterales bacterium]